MLQSMGSQRVGYDWANEQQQKSYFLGESITWKYTFSQKIELRFKSGQTYIVPGWICIYSDNLSEAKINLCWKLRSLRVFTIFNIKCLTLNENLSSKLAKYNKNKKCQVILLASTCAWTSIGYGSWMFQLQHIKTQKTCKYYIWELLFFFNGGTIKTR